jgi:hypothetical protein
VALSQFSRAATEDEVLRLWDAAAHRGEIPGAYWAVMTHPAATATALRHVFGEVHMLSHLVGAANRADIRRLRQLEEEKAALEEKLARQQAQLRDALVERDARIRDLSRSLARMAATSSQASLDGEGERAAWTKVAADGERRLASEAARRERAERRLDALEQALAEERDWRLQSESREQALREELMAIEARFGAHEPSSPPAEPTLRLGGITLLYVGGRPNQVQHLKALARSAAADLLHHDGGIEHGGAMLAGLASRADAVLFPVDCISHDAALAIKRLCRQAGKPFLALRSSGLSSFLAALARPEIARQGSTEPA